MLIHASRTLRQSLAFGRESVGREKFAPVPTA